MDKNTQFKLKLFGGFQLIDGEGNVVDPGPRKVKAMIAWLAVHANTEYPREKIATLFWPDAEDEGARHSLRQALGSLRKIVPDDISPVRISKDTLLFDSARAVVDVLEFDKALAEGEIHASETITELYQGELLAACNPRADLFEEWLADQRNHYRERATNAMCQRLTALIDTRQFEAAVPMGMRLVNIDKLRESAYRGLMMAHMGLGNHALALRWYHRCERELLRELNVLPCLETRALHAKLLSGWNSVQADGGRQQDVISRKKKAQKLVSKGHQRILYQVESAIEAITDQLGGQSMLLRGDSSTRSAEPAEQIIKLAELQGFAVCRGAVTASGEQAREDQAASALSARISNCLGGGGEKPASHQVEPGQQIEDILDTIRAAADVKPVLLLIQNIHNAGGRTLELLGRLIATVGETSALLVMTMTYQGDSLDKVWQGAMVNAPLTTIDLA